MDRAIDALWAYHERPAPAGCAGPISTAARRWRNTGWNWKTRRALLTACRAFLPDFDGLSREEAIAVSAVIEIAEIIGAIPPQPRTLPEEPLPED
jgi:hypothetical protein